MLTLEDLSPTLARLALLTAVASAGQVFAANPQERPSATLPAQEPALQKEESLAGAHAEFRKDVLAELERVAGEHKQRLSPHELLIMSCADNCVIAGTSTTTPSTDITPLPADIPGQQEKPDPDQPPRGQVIGMVVIVGGFGAPRATEDPTRKPSGPDASASAGADLPTGPYLVRRDLGNNAVQLIGKDLRVAATIPIRVAYHPERTEGAGDVIPERQTPAPGTRTADQPNIEKRDWPRVFLAILQYYDRRLSS